MEVSSSFSVKTFVCCRVEVVNGRHTETRTLNGKDPESKGLTCYHNYYGMEYPNDTPNVLYYR